MAAVATNNVWGVGFQKADNNATTLRQVLIEHYDGTSWTALTNTSANNPTGASNALFGIKAFSATDIWAVGESKTSATAATALIEHYDGTGWTTKTPASTTAGFSFLSDVLPLGASDVWAAGGQGGAVLIEHYNGTSWSQGPMPLPPTNVFEFLSDIAGVANDIWAVGGRSTSSTTDQTITMHYDGTGWKYVASPSPAPTASCITGSSIQEPGAGRDFRERCRPPTRRVSRRRVLASAPAAVSAAAGSADAFVEGSDLALWQFDTTSGWSGRGGKLATKPAATARGTSLDVLVEGLDQGLWHWTNAGGTPFWELVGGRLAATPAAVSWGASRLDVLVEGTDSQLWHAWSTASGATGNWRWEGLGGKISGSPAAVTWGANRLDGFVRGTDNHLWHLPFD